MYGEECDDPKSLRPDKILSLINAEDDPACPKGEKTFFVFLGECKV